MRQRVWHGAWIVLAALGGIVCGADAVNVAPLGTATQSSEYGGGAYPASNAINENFGDFTHTIGDTSDPDPWWQVALPAEFEISAVVLYNRTSCCGLRLRDITVVVEDEDGTQTYQSELLNPENVLASPLSIAVDIVADAGAAVKGAVVRVHRTGDPDLSGGGTTSHDSYVLSLGEVEVFGIATDLAPIITTQPAGGRVEVGQPFTMSVAAIGTEPLSYQWRKDDVDILGKTESTLQFAAVAASDGGVYRVVITNAVDDAVSEPAELTVLSKNIAAWGQASQSSVAYGGDPARANDGNTNQNWGGGSVTHTSQMPADPSPWWEVKLAGTSTIEMITLWNRSDCCWDRLSNFRVAVLSDARAEVYAEEFFTDGLGYVDPAGPFDIELPAAAAGRYVRVELLGPNSIGLMILSLAEVQVFGDGPEPPEDPNANLARGGTATQTSLLAAYTPDLAINGTVADFTHTLSTDPAPMWQLDLGAEESIGSIVLYNRTSCCGSRLRDITVSVWDAAGTTELYRSELLNPENVLGTFPNGPASLAVDLIEDTGATVKGQVIRVERTPDPDLSGTGGLGNPDEAAVLSLAEVEVYRQLTCPAQGDSHCAGLTYEGPAHGEPGSPGLYWVHAAATDDSGDAPYITISADNGVTAPATFGPARVYGAPFLLTLGTWTLTVRADDSLVCTDEAADAACTVTLDLTGDPDNVAPGGTATQSSTVNNGIAPRAIDGATDGVFDHGSVIHTDPADPFPWWEVDLGAAFELDRIVLWNRIDPCIGCMERLSNFKAAVLDESRTEAFAESFFTDFTGFADTTDEGFEIALPPGTAGRFVRIEILGPGTSGETILNLAEVQAFRGGEAPAEIFVLMGNVNTDSKVDIADAIALLGYLFGGGAKPPPVCAKAADANDDNKLDIADAIKILGYLFSQQAMLAPDHGTITAATNVCTGYAAGGVDDFDAKPYFPAQVSGLPPCAAPCR